MKKIELFERALCCSTGVCGPSVDKTLLMITSAFEAMDEADNIDADRHNLRSDPAAFVNNPLVLKAIQDEGRDILPMTLVDGKVVKSGEYPTKEELTEYTGLEFAEPEVEQVNAEGGKSDCC